MYIFFCCCCCLVILYSTVIKCIFDVRYKKLKKKKRNFFLVVKKSSVSNDGNMNKLERKHLTLFQVKRVHVRKTDKKKENGIQFILN